MKSIVNRNGSVSTANETGYLARRMAHHISSKLGDSSLEGCFFFYRCESCEHIDFVVKNIYTRHTCFFTFTLGGSEDEQAIQQDINRLTVCDATEAIHIIQLICGEFGIEPRLKKNESEAAPYWKNTTLNKRFNLRKATDLHYLNYRDNFLDNVDLKRHVTITAYVGGGFNYFANDGGEHVITVPAEQAKDFTLTLLDAPIGLDVIIDAQSASKLDDDYLFTALIGLDNENKREVVGLLLEALTNERYGYICTDIKAWDEKEKITGLSLDWFVPKES